MPIRAGRGAFRRPCAGARFRPRINMSSLRLACLSGGCARSCEENKIDNIYGFTT
jgi:hypothetical protein